MSWALVTGASARGGAAISRAIHGAGLSIVLHHSDRSRDAARALHAELLSLRDGSALLWESDFTRVPAVPGWIIDLAPQVCVCNASLYRPSQLGDATLGAEDWSVHVASHAAILHALRPGLRAIVAVTDIHVERPARGYVWYTVAKAGLQALTLALAIEWAPAVRCNVVAPGALPLPNDWVDDARARAVQASIPLARLGEFADLAAAVKWLALDAGYVTGQVLAVDGGRSRWLA
jgi:pteridine reductase